MKKNKGFFITLEGGEGSGKSSLASYLKETFESKGQEVVLTREPGGCPFAEKLRSYLLETDDVISSKTELLLFLASRAEHIDSLIAPALERGACVICDRFTDSTLAYQGYARELGVDEILPSCLFAQAGAIPDRTYLLDLDPELGFERIEKRNKIDRIEGAGLTFHQKVRAGFLELAKKFPERITLIDASLSLQEVQKAVVSDLREHNLWTP